MIPRTAVFTLLFAIFASPAPADVLVVKDKRGKLKVLGMPPKAGPHETEVTPDNWRKFADESTGFIDRQGYDGVEFRDREKRKAEFYPKDEIDKHFYTTEPDGLLEGLDRMSTGNWAQALGALQDVLANPDAREVFKVEARYRIGICYVAAGNLARATTHFEQWPAVNSTYTPEVYRILAELHTERKAYAKAREWYAKIGTLAGATEDMKFLAQLGDVRVDIAERKFGDAEGAAKRIAAATNGKEALADAHAFAMTLQAESIYASQNEARYPDAESLLKSAAANLEGVSVTRRAHLFSTLGDVLYVQGKLEEARFPYGRVFCLYTAEPTYVANALRNAGQCFLDLSGRATNEAEKDALLIKGMKLLGECAGRYRGDLAAKGAARTYREHKAEYDAARKRAGEGVEEDADKKDDDKKDDDK